MLNHLDCPHIGLVNRHDKSVSTYPLPQLLASGLAKHLHNISSSIPLNHTLTLTSYQYTHQISGISNMRNETLSTKKQRHFFTFQYTHLCFSQGIFSKWLFCEENLSHLDLAEGGYQTQNNLHLKPQRISNTHLTS